MTGFTGRGSRCNLKDEGSYRASRVNLKLLSYSQGSDILTQDRTRVEVFCEGFDTEKNIHRLHRNLCNLWMNEGLLRNDVNRSHHWAGWHVGIGTFHRHYKTKVLQRNFRLNLSFITSRRIHYLAEFDVLVVR